MRSVAAAAAAVMVLVLVLVVGAAGADDATRAYRQHGMSAIAAHTKAVVDILKRGAPYREQLPLHTGALAGLAAAAGTWFPPGSEGGDARDAIWDEPDAFAARVEAFAAAALALDRAAAGEGDLDAAFAALGQSCKGCHDDFRDD